MPHTKKKQQDGVKNSDRLSQGKRIARAKALLKAKRAEECTFDPVARADFLTGFHKRKMERRSVALKKNEAEARQSRLAMRADLRAQRAAELTQRMAAHRASLGLDEQEDGEEEAEEWHGFDAREERKGLWAVHDYEDEAALVSVTVEEL